MLKKAHRISITNSSHSMLFRKNSKFIVRTKNNSNAEVVNDSAGSKLSYSKVAESYNNTQKTRELVIRYVSCSDKLLIKIRTNIRKGSLLFKQAARVATWRARSVSSSKISKRHSLHYIRFCNNSPSRSLTATNPLRTQVCGQNMTCKQHPNNFDLWDAISIDFDTEERP